METLIQKMKTPQKAAKLRKTVPSLSAAHHMSHISHTSYPIDFFFEPMKTPQNTAKLRKSPQKRTMGSISGTVTETNIHPFTLLALAWFR